MARMRTMRLGGINLRVHTRHEPAEYTALWKSLYQLRSIRSRGATGMMIGGMRQISEADGAASSIFGHLYRFINIDPSEPWFDIEAQKPAEDDDVAQVVIPTKLKPNLREIPYLFDVRRHQLYVQTGGAGDSVSIGLVDGLLEQLFSFPQIFTRFGEVNHTIMSRTGLVEELLLWPEIRHISVVLERPNPTDFDDDTRFAERMRRRNVSKEKHEFFKAPGEETIVPDTEMVDMFNRAVTDGEYEQRGVNLDMRVDTASSKQHPREEIGEYDPDFQTETDAFIELTARKFG